MSKKTWYWIIGIILAVVVVGIIWWAAAKPSPTPLDPSAEPNVTDNEQMDHSSMDHGPSNQPEDSNLRGYLDEQNVIMNKMMQDMSNIEHSGSASIDFLTGMVPHHESAVTMSESYLKYGGTHAVLAPLAESIIATQTDEIDLMNSMIEELQAAGDFNNEQSQAYLEAYDKLMDHSMSHTTADSLDIAFADGMMMHHQMAVDMANAILPHTDNKNVKELAQAIIDTQEQEIKDMQAVLDELNKS